MFSQKLNDIAEKHPELRNAVQAFNTWYSANPKPEITSRDLVRGLGERLSAPEIAFLLAAMHDAGVVSIYYTVLDPEGHRTLVREDDVSEIGETAFDRRSAEFEIEDGEIVPVYAMVE